MFLWRKIKKENALLKEQIKKERELTQRYLSLSDSRGDFLFLLEGHLEEILEVLEQKDFSKNSDIRKKIEEEREVFGKHHKALLSSIRSLRREVEELEKEIWEEK